MNIFHFTDSSIVSAGAVSIDAFDRGRVAPRVACKGAFVAWKKLPRFRGKFAVAFFGMGWTAHNREDEIQS